MQKVKVTDLNNNIQRKVEEAIEKEIQSGNVPLSQGTIDKVNNVWLQNRPLPIPGNYDFNGKASVKIPNNHGTLTQSKDIRGTATAKVTGPFELEVNVAGTVSVY